jgi:hypothetical protein
MITAQKEELGKGVFVFMFEYSLIYLPTSAIPFFPKPTEQKEQEQPQPVHLPLVRPCP